ncbi:hypothetical protein [Bacteroides congonensis]|uniref:hypothetical protein n=1 Tax=Bacteroides congonensis TaxID=1871006 RepID=UPI000934AD11|nr:hypothetical protein [Bacteroides congonensis]
MCNTNNVLFRVDDTLYSKLTKIKTNYKFRSNAELAKTIVNVFCNIYSQKKRKEESIADIFKELEDGEMMFEYEKPKRSPSKRTQITLNEYLNNGEILLKDDIE